MKHFIAVTLLIALVTAGLALVLTNDNLLPTLASEEGVLVDRMFGYHWLAISFFFALVVVIMVYSAIVFRRRPGEEGDGAHFHGNNALEVTWTIIPLGIVLAFAAVGGIWLNEITTAKPNELVVDVIGAQWSWRFEYPDQGITSSELNLPVGQPVRFQFSSMDVVHSFWVPEFRMKQDVVPGQPTSLRVTPSLVGQYKLRCAELCGLNHDYMLATVNVMEPADFNAWVEGNAGN